MNLFNKEFDLDMSSHLKRRKKIDAEIEHKSKGKKSAK